MKEFNPTWNAGYDFKNPDNLREIESVEGYDLSADGDSYTPGQDVDSPWGRNCVVDVWKEGDIEFCKKNITIRPGYMLSLQRHRGREEIWAVLDGTLTVILNGDLHRVPKGESIFIPRGAPHCMINETDADVTVEEIQKGICRERDNIRLVDFSGRATYPLISEAEGRSALLYRQIMGNLKKS